MLYAGPVKKKVLITAQKPSLHTGHSIHSKFYQCQHFYLIFLKKSEFTTYRFRCPRAKGEIILSYLQILIALLTAPQCSFFAAYGSPMKIIL